MKNVLIGLKKFFSNKNTVTVICVLVAVLVLYIGYNMRIKAAVTPITVPYATKTIDSGTEITEDMVGTIQVPPSMLKGSPYRSVSQVLGKYASVDTIIPMGSLFYAKAVVSQAELPDSIIYNYPDGYVLVNMSLDINTSYGNAIYPGNYIDIYLKAVNKLDESTSVTTQQDKIMVGKLIENVKVIAVLDSNGKNVFENLEENRMPSMMIFAVPPEYHILLRKAMYLRTYDATLFPVPTNESLKETPGEVRISSQELQNWINTVTYWTDDMNSTDPIQ